MTVQIIFDAADGVNAAQQLLDFVGVISGGADKLAKPPTIRSTQPTPEKTAKADAPYVAPVAPKPAAEEVKPAEATAEAPTVEEGKPEPAKEETVAARRNARSGKGKKDEAPAAEAPKDAAKAEAPGFTVPNEVNDKLKDDTAAGEDVQKVAQQTAEGLAPKKDEAPTINYCRALWLWLATKKGLDYNRKWLRATYNIGKILDLPSEKYGEFVSKVKAEIGG